MKMPDGVSTEISEEKSTFKKLFYVNRSDFKVNVDPEEGKLGKVRTPYYFLKLQFPIAIILCVLAWMVNIVI